MTSTERLAKMVECILLAQAPHLKNRLLVGINQQEKLFVAVPRGSRVSISFGRQTFGHPGLMGIIAEAVIAAEALLYGISTAAAIRLDASTRWAHEQRMLPCSD